MASDFLYFLSKVLILVQQEVFFFTHGTASGSSIARGAKRASAIAYSKVAYRTWRESITNARVSVLPTITNSREREMCVPAG